MYDLILYLTLTVLAGQSLGQNEDGTWNVGQFPDPILYPNACGREGPSFVCDPESNLPLDKVNLIDGILKSIYNETNSGCYSVSPKRIGWMVMLAVVPKMEKYFTKNRPDNMRMRYKEAVAFSYFLSTPLKWGNHSNNCDNMAVIIYAVKDNVMFTMTRSRMKEVLTDEDLQGITWEALTRFNSIRRRPTRAADYITFMVRQYRKLLGKKKVASG